MSDEPNVIPLGTPSRAELWRRSQLAVSLLNQRGPTAETAWLVRRVLLGEQVSELRAEEVPRGT